MYSISKSFEFDAAHRLYQLPKEHKCHNLHGHTWKVEVCIESENLDDRGFILDYGELKSIIEEIKNLFDHGIIIAENDEELIEIATKLNTKYYIISYSVVSAETIARFIAEQMLHVIIGITSSRGIKIKKLKVKVWETRTNKASYEIDVV